MVDMKMTLFHLLKHKCLQFQFAFVENSILSIISIKTKFQYEGILSKVNDLTDDLTDGSIHTEPKSYLHRISYSECSVQRPSTIVQPE